MRPLQLGVPGICRSGHCTQPKILSKAAGPARSRISRPMNSLQIASNGKSVSVNDLALALGTAALAVLILRVVLPTNVYAQSATPTPNPVATVSESDLVHYGDLIDVEVLGSLEYDWRGTLNPEGFLDGLAHSNEPVYGLCQNTDQIAAEILRQYAKFLRDPKIVVSLVDRSGRAVAMLSGAVKNPQRFRLKREARLAELLTLSGGIVDTASGEITIFRPGNLNCLTDKPTEGDRSSFIHVRISDLLSGDDRANPLILSGDIINVVEASPIYVIGGVNSPRQIASRADLSVSRAVSTAGGLTKDAVESDITIYRREAKTTRILLADLKKIRSKQQDDILLKPFDIVDIGQKGRAKLRFPPTVDFQGRNRDIYKIPVRVIE